MSFAISLSCAQPGTSGGRGLDATSDNNALLARIAGGDTDALRQFYDATSSRAYGLALEITGAQRTAQAACETVYADLASMAQSHSGDLQSFEVAVLNRVREVAVKDRRERAAISSASNDSSYTMVKVIRDCLDGLDPLARQALELAYFGGLDVNAISTIVGRPASELRPMLRNALLALGAATRPQESPR